MEEKTSRFDFSSIRFRVWLYFIFFAVALLVLVWVLQIYFLDNYYEEMKLYESERIAGTIVDEYKSGIDAEDFNEMLEDISEVTDIYIQVETGAGELIYAPHSSNPSNEVHLKTDTLPLRYKLHNSSFDAISEVVQHKQTRILSYACYLYEGHGDTDQEQYYNSIILYLFSPLHPVSTTVIILRRQLFYITMIALFLGFVMAIYLATHISRPIKSITNSAAEMGRGNYGVQFNGGPYTEMRELADTLSSASEELEKTSTYQKDLVANVSHDLKTPLTMIKSYAEMIRDLSGNSPEKREQHLGVIIEETDRLNSLVDDMLTMSRMQQRRIELSESEFDLSECIESLLASYDILAEQEGYNFKFNNIGPMLVKGDETRIRQVLSNLINNAVKYCGQDKQITIVAKKVAGKKVRCEVKDNGQGIAPDELSHIWERYYKSSTHHVRPTEGSGLGLSIVKEILNLHKAQYGVKSKEGKGSTFWFELDQVPKRLW